MQRPSTHPSAEPVLALLASAPAVRQPLLLHGSDRATLGTTARFLAASWLCAAADRPCGACGACRDVTRGLGIRFRAHDAGLDGGVETVREFRAHAATRGDGLQILVLENADAATPQALQLLLKLLEEVPLGSAVLLTAARPMLLPDTLRSRCLTLSVPPATKRAAAAAPAVRDAVTLLTGPLADSLGVTDVPDAATTATAVRTTLLRAYGLAAADGEPPTSGPRIARFAAAGTAWLHDVCQGRFNDRSSFERLTLATHA